MEPFVGCCNIVSSIKGKRIAYDINKHLIQFWKECSEGTFQFPNHQISEEEYKEYRSKKDQTEPSAILGFVGIALAFGGDWFHGFAKDKTGKRNYQEEAMRSAKKKATKMKDVEFYSSDYRLLTPENKIIYCDPPYDNTVSYNGSNEKFDSSEFWNIMGLWSKTNTVLVSEYKKPDDVNAELVWQKEVKLSVRSKNGCESRVEKLFLMK